MQEIKYIPLGELIERDDNPKDHDLGMIVESIKRFGFIAPIVIDEGTGKLVAGHGRLHALRLLKEDKMEKEKIIPENIQVENGEWLVPVVSGVAFKSDVEALAYTIADNRLVELGGWHDEFLLEGLKNVQLEDSLIGTGFELDDIDDLLKRTGVLGDDKSLFLSQFLDEVGEEMSKTEYMGKDEDTVYFKLTFALTEEQRSTVLNAIRTVKKDNDLNNSTDALVHICKQIGE